MAAKHVTPGAPGDPEILTVNVGRKPGVDAPQTTPVATVATAPSPPAATAKPPASTVTSASDPLPDNLLSVLPDAPPEIPVELRAKRYFVALKPDAPVFELAVGSITPGVQASVTFRKETFQWAAGGEDAEEVFKHYGLTIELTDDQVKAILHALSFERLRVLRNRSGACRGVQRVVTSPANPPQPGDLMWKQFLRFERSDGRNGPSLAEAPGGSALMRYRDYHLAVAGAIEDLTQERRASGRPINGEELEQIHSEAEVKARADLAAMASAPLPDGLAAALPTAKFSAPAGSVQLGLLG